MDEWLPVVLGLLWGAIAGARRPDARSRASQAARRRATAAIALGVVAAGGLASAVSGELAVSWWFVLVDTGIVALATGAALVVHAAVRRRERGRVARPGARMRD